ncbi:MAG: hypothetical protein PHS49_00575 [Candidatus Gracilibacteria bacterium]|nr:hypothetical protein [Candidatus Gracilibacteria bacterium]
MTYTQSIYNNTRYIVFIQTKYHQNILPVNDVSPHSLEVLLKCIGNYKGYLFRSIRIYRDDITRIKVYEMNFINYKKNVLEKSENWNKVYKIFSLISGFIDWILYLFVYKREVNKFGTTITNIKPKYLIDKTEAFHNVLYGKNKEFKINNDGKEIVEQVDFHNGKLYINEKPFELDESLKANYFLELFTKYIEKQGNTHYIELYEFIDLYEKNCEKDGYDYNYLKLSSDNVKKSYIKTINDNILKKYNKEILEISKNFIGIIQDLN